MSKISKLTCRLIVFALVLVLSGCGFHLRDYDGASTLSVGFGHSVKIQTNIPGLRFKLANSFRDREFRLVSENPDYVVEVFGEIHNEEEFGLETDLTMITKPLNYEFQYQFHKQGETVETEPGKITIESDYTRIGSSELAKETTKLAALERIRQDAANLLAERLVNIIVAQ